MKLSSLVHLKNQIKTEIDTKSIQDEIDKLIIQINHIADSVSGTYADDLRKVAKKYEGLKAEIDLPQCDLPVIVGNIDSEIDKKTKNYFARGYRIVEEHIATNHTDVHGERTLRVLPISEKTRQVVIGRAHKYSDWHYPGLEIGPGDGIWTEHLVGNDPLYIVDQHQEFLDSTLSKFNEQYRRRVRPYLVGHALVREGADTDLSFLPDNQFGFIFSWNLFNYFPLEHIRQYLTHCIRILRPGGVMMFSYNNGENPVCVDFVEQGWMSYMPKSLLVSLAENLGFEVIATFDADEFIHWIEIKKPGELKTVKAHQAMGEIKFKTS